MTGASRARAQASPLQQAQRYDALLGSLARRIVDRAVGTSVPTRTRLTDQPHKQLWLGMLASEPQLIAEAALGYQGPKITPPAQGFTFRVRTLPAAITVDVSCATYLALHPTLEEQRASVRADADPTHGTASSGAPNPGGARAAARTAPATTRAPKYKLAQVWTKTAVEPVRLIVPLPRRSGVTRVGQNELSAALRAAVRVPADSQLFRPCRGGAARGSLPRDYDLADEAAWARYCAENLVDAADIIPPEHRAAVEVEITPAGDCYEIMVSVVNTTPPLRGQTYDGAYPYEEAFIDVRLHQVRLSVTTDAALVPYELEQVAQSFRYDRTVEAFGHACPVTVSRVSDGFTSLSTEFAAQEPTWRAYPRKFTDDGSGERVGIDTSFDSLIADPIGTLTRLVDLHQIWVDRHWGKEALDTLARERRWGAEARAEAEEDARAAREEVKWVRAGLEVLRSNAAVRDAFVAANRVVKATAKDKYDSWRPFQVAWILGCLPGMVDPAGNSKVNIVWFTTGGGKSEAYLSLMLVTLFYGRYTGITAGTQVWARFPLRLLALQQTERFAAMVLHAELLRRDDPRIAGGDPFGVGYFVGGGNTPNKLQRPDANNPYYRGQDPFAPGTAEACRVLQRCPICEDPRGLEVSMDEPTWTMRHICRNAACPMVGVLPVWGVDDDVYRHAPSVLVGTVDKLAQLGQSPSFQVLLGRAHSRCPQHGYTGNPLWCAVYPCSRPRQPIPDGFGHVRLEIADEMHLLDESLGALDGMYETLLQTINARLHNAPFQIVGATATIEGYENQVEHLYQREARRFPVNGPADPGETFWSTTHKDEPLRRYLGVRSRASGMVTATREVAVTHARWVTDLCNDPKAVVAEAGLDANDPDIVAEAQAAGRDLYEVLVAYCLRNEDLTSFTRDDKVREVLTSQENLAIINGDTDPAIIRSAVDRLVKPREDDKQRIKIIAATKAIGHGFDVARLGVMAVMGTPTQAAEVIQASARVGRRHPGLVVNVINPARDRDASVFRYYAEWIRYLDRLVHKVPVNRESLPVLKRVLPGGLMAWLLQVHDRGWITGGPRRKSLAQSTAFRDAVTAGVVNRALLIDNLARGFGIDPTSVYHDMHREAISVWVDDQLTTLPLRAEGNKRLPELLSPPVPRSLRDIEEPLTIYGDV